jgi:Calcineurin-like phosphoesterase
LGINGGEGGSMQKTVRDVGTVLDWMNGTRQLIQSDDPRFKATAMKAFNITTEADWQNLKAKLLAQIDASTQNAKKHAHSVVDSKGALQSESFVPQDKIAAVFQSAMEEHLNDRMTTSSLAEAAGIQVPYGPPEKFDSGDAGWMVVVVARLEQAMAGKAQFIHHADMTSFRHAVPESTTIALFADWGTGEPPAIALKSAIEKFSPEFTIHLGDTYYAGFKDEISHNLFACWPGGVQFGKCFTMNGNHEMYCGGKPYFNLIPTLGQAASYFNLGNQYWRFIALDTSWCERDGDTPASSWGELVDIQLPWLDAQIKDARAQFPQVRFILLTHHQMFSAFDGDDLGQYLRTQLKPHLDRKDFFAWFWGHEHRGIVYDDNSTYNFKARCIGHGGFPYAPCTDVPTHEGQFPILWREERCEPNNAWYGMRGFAILTLSAQKLHIEYVDQQGVVQHSEDW